MLEQLATVSLIKCNDNSDNYEETNELCVG